MSVYAIVLVRSNEEVKSRIHEHFPGYYEYNPTFFLVEADALAEGVAISVGIKGDSQIENVSGFVIKLEEFSYSGYTARSLWEWLKESGKRTQ